VAACTPATPTLSPTAVPTAEPTPADPSAAATQAVIDALAYNLSIPAEDIQVASLEAFDWPDSCLGAGTGSMACAQVITPGYRIILAVGGKYFEYRTNLNGSSIILVSTN
jgi:hypothetical protein